MKLPFWATICTLIAVIILCGLGTWQLQRLQEKNALISSLEDKLSQDIWAKSFSTKDLVIENDLARGFVVGEYMHYKPIKITSKVYDGQTGYHLYVPVRLPGVSGKVLIVNRGWIPNEGAMAEGDEINQPPRKIKIAGTLRAFPQANKFTPVNDLEQGVWYHPDMEDIKKSQGFADVFPVILQVEGEVSKNVELSKYPVFLSLQDVMPNNNHLQYAVFWFSMALVLMAVYGFRFIRPQMKKED